MLGTICSSVSCEAPCDKCGTTKTECISCADPLFLDELSKTCVTSNNCPPKMFADPVTRKCVSCPEGCN